MEIIFTCRACEQNYNVAHLEQPVTECPVCGWKQKQEPTMPFEEDQRILARAADASADKFDKAWDIVRGDPELAFARQRLSMHEIRHIIRAVAAAFS